MKKFWLILLSVILGLFTACSDDTNSNDNNNCKPECKAYETCNDKGTCELTEGMCSSSTDCPESKPICDANECIAESTDCNPVCNENFQECNSGTCETKEGMCADNNDCSNDTPVCSTDHKCISDDQSVTIKDLKDSGEEGNKYTTHGIVTAKDHDGFFMQDESDRGIYVYMNLSDGEFMEQEIGDKVTVTGMYKIHRGLNQLTYFLGDTQNPAIDLDIKTDSSNNTLPEFKEIDAGIKTLENFESMLVKLKNPDFTIEKKLQDPSNRDYIVTDSLNKKFTANDYIYNLESLATGNLAKIQGVLKYHKEEYKLVPRTQDDIEEATFECVPACDDSYQVCKLVDSLPKCDLKEGMCENQIDCEETQICDNHACITPTPINLVPNGDFETWNDNDDADGWIFEFDNRAGTTGMKESSVVFEGNFSAKVKKICNNSNGDYLSPAFPIDVNKSYNVSMQIYDNDPKTKARIYFKFYDDTDHSNGMTNFGDYTTNVDAWKEYKFNNSDIFAGIDPGDETGQLNTIKTMRVGIRLYDESCSDGDNGFIYIDSVKVTEK